MAELQLTLSISHDYMAQTHKLQPRPEPRWQTIGLSADELWSRFFTIGLSNDVAVLSAGALAGLVVVVPTILANRAGPPDLEQIQPMVV